MTELQTEVRQLSTLVVGAAVILLLMPALAIGLMMGPWAGLVIGFPLTAAAIGIKTPPHLRMPRALVAALGLCACAYSILVLVLG